MENKSLWERRSGRENDFNDLHTWFFENNAKNYCPRFRSLRRSFWRGGKRLHSFSSRIIPRSLIFDSLYEDQNALHMHDTRSCVITNTLHGIQGIKKSLEQSVAWVRLWLDWLRKCLFRTEEEADTGSLLGN